MPDLIGRMSDAPSFRVVPPSEKLSPDQILGKSSLPDGTEMFQPGGFLVPPARSFSTIVNAASRVYSYRWDEAMRDSFVNARAMRRDAFLLGLLEERILPTINRTFQLKIKDERDPEQKAVRDGIMDVIKRIPDFDAYKRAQMDAVWFGRAGCQWGWRRDEELNYRWGIPKWDPIHGDSVQYTFDGIPAILIDGQTAAWYSANGATWGPTGDLRPTDRGGTALVLHRPYWRDRFAIHVHMRQKADFFEGELAGSVQGLGLRGQVYWQYVVRTDALTWMLAYMQAVGQMDLLVFNYPAGNAEAKANQEANAQKIIGKAAIACPRNPTGNWPAIEQIQMNSAGLKALHDLVADYFDRHIERLIVGQSMSSGADKGDGLGGTGRAQFAKQTKDEILVYDTQRLDYTMSQDLILPIKKYNYGKAKFPVTYESILPNLEAEGKVESGGKLVSMGIAIKTDEIREAAGYSRPEPGDETVGGPPSMEEMMMQAMQQGGGAPGGAPPAGPGGPPMPPTNLGPAAVFSGGQTGMAHQLPPGAPVPNSRYARNPVRYAEMHDHPEHKLLVRAIDANPLDATAHLAHADWLEENGFPDEAAFRRGMGNWIQHEPVIKRSDANNQYPWAPASFPKEIENEPEVLELRRSHGSSAGWANWNMLQGWIRTAFRKKAERSKRNDVSDAPTQFAEGGARNPVRYSTPEFSALLDGFFKGGKRRDPATKKIVHQWAYNYDPLAALGDHLQENDNPDHNLLGRAISHHVTVGRSGPPGTASGPTPVRLSTDHFAAVDSDDGIHQMFSRNAWDRDGNPLISVHINKRKPRFIPPRDGFPDGNTVMDKDKSYSFTVPAYIVGGQHEPKPKEEVIGPDDIDHNNTPRQYAEGGGGTPPSAGPVMGGQYYPGGGNTYIPKMGRLGKSLKNDTIKTTRYARDANERLCSTQVNLTGIAAIRALDLGFMIPEADLSGDGREQCAHVTARYGLHEGTLDGAADIIKDFGRITLRLGGISHFSGEEHDVVIIEVDSPDLVRLNKELGKLPNTQTHPTYKPHCTLAYVKKGQGKRIAEQLPPCDTDFTADAVVYSDCDKNPTWISVVNPMNTTDPILPYQRKLVRYSDDPNDYPEHQQLQAAIHADPLEATGHLAHADWLEENGFPEEAGFRKSMADWVSKKWMKNPALSIYNPRKFGESMPWTVYPTKGRIPAEIDDLEIPSVAGLSHVRRDTAPHVGVPLLPNSTHLFWKSYPDMEEAMRQAYHRTKKYRAERGIPPTGNPGRYARKVGRNWREQDVTRNAGKFTTPARKSRMEWNTAAQDVGGKPLAPTEYAEPHEYPEHQQLLAAIHADPLEATTHLAHADWLEENGFDPGFRKAMAKFVAKPWQAQRALSIYSPHRSESMPWRLYPVGTRLPEGINPDLIPRLPGYGSLRSDTPRHVGVPLGDGNNLHWRTYSDMEEGLRRAHEATQKQSPIPPWSPGMRPTTERHAARAQENRNASIHIPDDEDPTPASRYAADRAPVDGIVLGSKTYRSGQFLPSRALVRSTQAERNAVESGDSRWHPLPPPVDEVPQDVDGQQIGFDAPVTSYGRRTTRYAGGNPAVGAPQDDDGRQLSSPAPDETTVPHLGHPQRKFLGESEPEKVHPNHDENGTPLGQSESHVFHFPGGTKGLFKPASGEMHARTGVGAGNQYHREVATSVVADILGLGHMVPKTTYRDHNGEVGSIQHWVDGTTKPRRVSFMDRYGSPEHTAHAGVLDYLTGQSDRHEGNWLVGDNGKIHLIDNGNAFPRSYHDETYNGELLSAANRLPLPEMVKNMGGHWPAIKKALRGLGIDEPAIALTEQRFKHLINPKHTHFYKLPKVYPGA